MMLRLAVLLCLPCVLGAQAPVPPARAAGAITPEDVRHRIEVLANDSMRGRDTPSPQLDQVASWIAAEFRRFGLRPGGTDGTFLQHYDIVRSELDTAQTALTVARGGGPPVVLKAGSEMDVLPFGPPPLRDVSGPVVLLTGRADSTPDPLAGADLRGAWIAELATSSPTGNISVDLNAAQAALGAGAVGLLVISDRSDDQWRARISSHRPFLSVGDPPATALEPALVEIRDAAAVRALGLDVGALRAERDPRARRLSGVTLTFHAQRRVISTASAPNVIGILDGSDPILKNEYVFFTAHMDHIGVASLRNPACRARGADSICNGADDDASGDAAVMTIAQACSRLAPRPRRSLVFMTVSGEEKGLWGSEYFTTHPVVPLSAVVADLNIDMVGRNWRDTIAVIGKEQSDLGTTLDRVAQAHPELNMRPIGDIWPMEHFYSRSDHFNFARRGVPILFFFNGTHPDYHQVSDEVAKIDAEKESRIARLIFYLGIELANTTARPRWDPDAYKRVVDGAN
ncbi:MAG TPA: M28 family peptidase [Gemmatimonadales bacterium]|nr:M28 family peptidase [Gemmatimonadales bacterium]